LDLLGKTVLKKTVNVETGSNTIPLEIGQLTNGTYLVKLLCNNCEAALGKFIKR